MPPLNSKGFFLEKLFQYTSRLRFPKLFLITAFFFLGDLLLPDAIPFADEILLGLVTTLLAMLKNRNGPN